MHDLPNGLRGVLCYCRQKVGILLKAKADKALFLPLLPVFGDIEIISLREYGFYLQKVRGDDLCVPVVHSSELLMHDNHVKMSTTGPDVYRCPPINFPSEFNSNISSLHTYLTVDNKARKPPFKPAVVYVRSNPERFEAKLKKGYLVPVGRPKRVTQNYFMKHFAILDRAKITELSKMVFDCRDEFDKFVNENAVGSRTLVVPMMKKQYLRIKVVSELEFQKLKCEGKHDFLATEKDSYLFGFEDICLDKTPGLLVSLWVSENILPSSEIKYGYIEDVQSVYGRRGFGGRSCSNCLGFNGYRDAKNSFRPLPSPLIAPNEVHLHQFYNYEQEKKGHALLQPVVEKVLRKLTREAVSIGRRHHSQLTSIIGEVCSKQIITCGNRPTANRNASCVLAFVNEPHTDTSDALTKKQVQELKLNIPTSNVYQRRWVDAENCCLYTTCGYQFIYKDGIRRNENRLCQFFSLEGLGIAMPLSHGIAHHFLGAMFAHSTCLCMKFNDKTGAVTAGNNSDNCSVLAWGRSGGSKEYRLRRQQRIMNEAMQGTESDKRPRTHGV